jgi:DNA-binding XRE family transcriptional regulator
MTTTLKKKLQALPKNRQTRIAKRVAELVAEEMSLQALRQARALTQAHMAKTLGVAQESVSRLEKRKDVLLSTLSHYVEAMGGRLRVTVEFPDHPAVRLADLPRPARKSRKSVVTKPRRARAA